MAWIKHKKSHPRWTNCRGLHMANNLTGLTYPNGKTVTRGYDNANRLTSVSDWLGHTTQLGYDQNSNLTSQTYPNAIVATGTFDAADENTAISDTLNGGTLASFTYTRNKIGQLTGDTSTGLGQPAQTYGYDSLNRLTGVNTGTYSYDNADNLTGLTSGATLAYDTASQVTSMSSGGSSVAYSYNADGDRTQGGVPGGALYGYSYDQADRLTKTSSLGGAQGLIGAGQFTSLAAKSDGTAWAWGYNGMGELGNGTTTNSTTPVQVSNLTGVTAVSGMGYSSMALRSDGTVWDWGDNAYGELGNGTTTTSSVPVQVQNLTGVTAIAGGAYHGVALKSDGTVWTWGYNADGQLGNGTTTNTTTPVQVSGLTGVIAIAAGGFHTLAVKSDGTVWAWGWNNYGQLGNGTTTDSTTPIQVSGLTGVTQVAGGSDHSLAVKSDGTVWAWGYNNYGQVGAGGRTVLSPQQVTGLTSMTEVAGGGAHSLARKSDGTVWAWGYNKYGELGNGSTTNSSTPVEVSNLTGATAIAAGSDHSIALLPSSGVEDWGNGQYGQLGDGSTANSSTPVAVNNLTGVQGEATLGTYSYDGDGLRASKTVNGATSQYAWDLSGGTALLLADGATSYVYGANGAPIEQIDANGTPTYLQHDQLGSTRLITDAAGNVTATYSYDSYGNTSTHTGTGTTAFLYAGQYEDSESGLYYLRARYYDPNSADFVTRDPLASITGSPYSYALDSPLSFTDATGLATSGYCASGSLTVGFAVYNASVCLIKTDNDKEVGATVTLGGSLGQTSNFWQAVLKYVANNPIGALASLFSEAGGAAYQSSNATHLCELRGKFSYKQASLGLFGWGASKLSFTNHHGLSGSEYEVGKAGFGFSASEGLSNTWLYRFPNGSLRARAVSDFIDNISEVNPLSWFGF